MIADSLPSVGDSCYSDIAELIGLDDPANYRMRPVDY
jgi:hypothetical protein